MKVITSLAAAFAFCALSGCSLFSSKSIEPRQLHVTLIGGSRLNVGASGEPRPVQSCVYIVRSADWVPMTSGDSSCSGRDQDGTVVTASRHVIAPNQVLQFWVDVPRSGEIWLVTDADYAERPAQYAPLHVRIEGGGVIHLSVWLDRSGIYNASLPGPVPLVLDAPNGATEKNARHRGADTRRIRQ
ncbi:type VI secretion system-associated lipoprotein [Burkholderia ubonensis]|uniref:type VI secretion lipoprotein TssJ n=1 Tax=Burkholderia ubonensis TaxID=101571 RepID=UPI000752E3EE|nr:type VI secretion lipoprotein TssJ [Burkholderia ubonensis]KVQ20002.1 type VI secretion lipofamily protein [Burkholderia ubonensis]OJB06777.1 type VI secretion system-associated lipoprotein [Burkholderia ubonensis]